ncbi:hypothetical protein B0H16DRAFT_1761204 [Mycena metata]|uniref:Uncharacterized protein n=1 Tax=Mycena metata TaxID=1033252 RepID=A0AAD7IBM7_9AGAR|nr:hypothetical protein B0H16DRAFT_1761204 [Mycena metata]
MSNHSCLKVLLAPDVWSNYPEVDPQLRGAVISYFIRAHGKRAMRGRTSLTGTSTLANVIHRTHRGRRTCIVGKDEEMARGRSGAGPLPQHDIDGNATSGADAGEERDSGSRMGGMPHVGPHGTFQQQVAELRNAVAAGAHPTPRSSLRTSDASGPIHRTDPLPPSAAASTFASTSANVGSAAGTAYRERELPQGSNMRTSLNTSPAYSSSRSSHKNNGGAGGGASVERGAGDQERVGGHSAGAGAAAAHSAAAASSSIHGVTGVHIRTSELYSAPSAVFVLKKAGSVTAW